MENERLRIEIKGTVQGVGFRPFVYKLALSLGLTGFVTNTRGSVIIEVEGENQHDFLPLLHAQLPKASKIISIETLVIPSIGSEKFEIIESLFDYGTAENITPDLAICEDCKREIEDPSDRRSQYPFNNCTQCGPRFTIIRSMPYDRKNTTMADFIMCSDCEKDYMNQEGRRYHAQPVSCHHCGPVLLYDGERTNAIENARAALLNGEILAIKGLGGFHLSCDAQNEVAVERLRSKKRRDTKPFAMMAKDVDSAKEFCEITPEEEHLLDSPAAPIVLLKSKDIKGFENPRIGIMLAYTPLHQTLFQDGIKALIMTSGNISSEPVCFRNEEAQVKLANIADHFITHNRDIYFRNDDSVFQCFEEQPYAIRRSRGFVPLGIQTNVDKQVLAFGADLKNTFSISKAGNIYPSHHIGDLENFEAVQGLEEGISHFSQIFEFTPQIIACDMHPGYVSSKLAQELAGSKGLRLIEVQHHHAHMVSCMVDNGLDEKVLGLVLDGTGYGIDGVIWGGELLEGDATSFERIGCIDQVPLLGGDLAVKQPWRNSLSWIMKIFDEDTAQKVIGKLINAGILPHDSVNISRIYKNQLNHLETSSAGRLFEAVSGLLGIRSVNTHEAQSAMELEWHALQGDESSKLLDKIEIKNNIFYPQALMRSLINSKLRGESVPNLALEFHKRFAEGLVELCKKSESSCKKIVLSGGVFQNTILLSDTKRLLQNAGFQVFIHRNIPCNDGGISIGQCFSANRQLLM